MPPTPIQPAHLPPTVPLCPRCKASSTARIKRIGLFKAVAQKLSYYPWECSGCRKQFYARSRGRLKRKRRTTGEVFTPPVQ